MIDQSLTKEEVQSNQANLHSAYTYAILYQLVRYNLELHYTDAYGFYQASLNVNLVITKDDKNHLYAFDYFYDGLSDQLDPTFEENFKDEVSVEIVNNILSRFINTIAIIDMTTYTLHNNSFFNHKVEIPLLIESNPIDFQNHHYKDQFTNYIQLVNAKRVPFDLVTPGKFYLSISTLNVVYRIDSLYKSILEKQSNNFLLEYILISGIKTNTPFLNFEPIKNVLKELNIYSHIGETLNHE